MKNWDMWWENWNFLLRFRKKEFWSLKCFRRGVIVHKLSSLTNFHNKNLISDCCAGSLLMIGTHYRRLDKINSHLVSSVYLNWNLKVDLKIWGDIVKQCTCNAWLSVSREMDYWHLVPRPGHLFPNSSDTSPSGSCISAVYLPRFRTV